MALNAVKAALSCAFLLNQRRPMRTSAQRNRCINATPFIGREKAHSKVGVLSSESFLFQIICHCLSNDHDFTIISQTEYALFRRYGIADSGSG